MFINEKGMINYFDKEQLEKNKEEAICEFSEWQIPTIENIAINIANMISKYIAHSMHVSQETQLTDDILDIILLGLKFNLEYTMDITDTVLANTVVHFKINDYTNRCYIAADLIRDQIKE